MNEMPRRRTVLKMGLIGLAVLAVASFAAAQAISGADRVLLLQAKRFEGTYKLASGETSVKITDNGADIKVSSGSTNLLAALAPKEGKPNRATFDLDGKTIEGKAEIEGRTMTLEFVADKVKYVFKISLSGRNEGEVSVKKGDAIVVAGTMKRA